MARDRDVLEHAKRLRTNQTPLEQKLWYALRAKRFEGVKFRRQVVIGRYVADFACRIPTMLVIEVDGDTHATQQSYDEQRTRFLQEKGYSVLRFSNRDVAENVDGVLTVIAQALASRLEGRGGSGEAAEGEGESMTGVSAAGPPLSPAAFGSSFSPLKGREI